MTKDEAILVLKNIAWFGKIYDQEQTEEAVDMAINALTAQPEQSSEIQDILDYLDTVLHPIISPENWNVYSELHDMISTLPSAQPETHEKRTQTHACDLISRKMVLALPRNEVRSLRTYEVVEETINVTDIEHLPSAQPEPEITDEQAIEHLQSSGWMQNHDKQMYEMGAKEQPQRTGRWIHQAKFGRIECDQCGKVYRNAFVPKNYCPNCGARMEGES